MSKYFNMSNLELIRLVDSLLQPLGMNWIAGTDELKLIIIHPTLGTWENVAIPVAKIPFVLSMSNGSSEDEKKKLLEFFWKLDDMSKTSKDPLVKQENCSDHDWIDVTLFNLVTKRCRYCDIKKPDDGK